MLYTCGRNQLDADRTDQGRCDQRLHQLHYLRDDEPGHCPDYYHDGCDGGGIPGFDPAFPEKHQGSPGAGKGQRSKYEGRLCPDREGTDGHGEHPGCHGVWSLEHGI